MFFFAIEKNVYFLAKVIFNYPVLGQFIFNLVCLHCSRVNLFNFYLIFMNIYVGNLSYKVRENDLQGVIEEYGQVESCKIIKDRETGKSKGFAFVEMADDSAAAKVIEELNGAEFDGRSMVVKEARPRT